MDKSKVIPRNVSMYPEQWEVVDAIDNRYGFRNASTALRFIIEEYRRLSGHSNREGESVVESATNIS